MRNIAATSATSEINFLQLCCFPLLHLKLLGQFALVFAIIGLINAQLSTRYISEGVLQTNKINASNYNKYKPLLLNDVNLGNFLIRNKQLNTESIQIVDMLGRNHKQLNEAIKPEFAFTDKDQRSMGVKSSVSDDGAIIGLRLSFEFSEPTLGAPVLLLGEYVRDTLVRLELESTINDQCLTNQTIGQSLRVDQIKNEFKIKQEKARAKTLRGLIGKVGEAPLPMVTLFEGGERYLSPQAQLNAVEISISELQLAQINLERELKASALKQDYYCEAVKILQKPENIDGVLAEMKTLQVALFKDQDRSVPIVDQTGLEFELQRDTWTSNVTRGMRFVSSPEGSEVKFRKLGHAKGLILGALLGSLLGIIFVFSRQWWQANKDEITAL